MTSGMRIDEPLSDKINVKANEDNIFSILLSGVPKPEVDWVVGTNTEKRESSIVPIGDPLLKQYKYSLTVKDLSPKDCGENVTFTAIGYNGTVIRQSRNLNMSCKFNFHIKHNTN